MGKMTGNEFLVKALQEEGVEKIFGYPGACVIDIFDEIYKQDQVELILPRVFPVRTYGRLPAFHHDPGRSERT